MEGNDLSNMSTPRTWVIEDVVLSREPVIAVSDQKARWWRRKAPQTPQEAVVVQPAPVSLLWRWGQRWAASGMRIELVHVGDEAKGEEILDLLDRSSSSPFTGVIAFPTLVAVVDALAFRPDVLHVVDVDDRFMRFGGRGMPLRDLG